MSWRQYQTFNTKQCPVCDKSTDSRNYICDSDTCVAEFESGVLKQFTSDAEGIRQDVAFEYQPPSWEEIKTRGTVRDEIGLPKNMKQWVLNSRRQRVDEKKRIWEERRQNELRDLQAK